MFIYVGIVLSHDLTWETRESLILKYFVRIRSFWNIVFFFFIVREPHSLEIKDVFDKRYHARKDFKKQRSLLQ